MSSAQSSSSRASRAIDTMVILDDTPVEEVILTILRPISKNSDEALLTSLEQELHKDRYETAGTLRLIPHEKLVKNYRVPDAWAALLVFKLNERKQPESSETAPKKQKTEASVSLVKPLKDWRSGNPSFRMVMPFVDREKEADAISKGLGGRSGEGHLPVVVMGQLPGIGKTRMALEFYEKLKEVECKKFGTADFLSFVCPLHMNEFWPSLRTFLGIDGSTGNDKLLVGHFFGQRTSSKKFSRLILHLDEVQNLFPAGTACKTPQDYEDRWKLYRDFLNELNCLPNLAVIITGNDPALVYRSISNALSEVGNPRYDYTHVSLPPLSKDDVMECIKSAEYQDQLVEPLLVSDTHAEDFRNHVYTLTLGIPRLLQNLLIAMVDNKYRWEDEVSTRAWTKTQEVQKAVFSEIAVGPVDSLSWKIMRILSHAERFGLSFDDLIEKYKGLEFMKHPAFLMDSSYCLIQGPQIKVPGLILDKAAEEEPSGSIKMVVQEIANVIGRLPQLKDRKQLSGAMFEIACLVVLSAPSELPTWKERFEWMTKTSICDEKCSLQFEDGLQVLDKQEGFNDVRGNLPYLTAGGDFIDGIVRVPTAPPNSFYILFQWKDRKTKITPLLVQHEIQKVDRKKKLFNHMTDMVFVICAWEFSETMFPSRDEAFRFVLKDDLVFAAPQRSSSPCPTENRSIASLDHPSVVEIDKDESVISSSTGSGAQPTSSRSKYDPNFVAPFNIVFLKGSSFPVVKEILELASQQFKFLSSFVQ